MKKKQRFFLDIKKHTNIELTPFNLKNLAHFKTSKKSTKSIDILKFKLIIKKRDTSSIEIIKNVNYFNYIPNVFKKNASMAEDISINSNYIIQKKKRYFICRNKKVKSGNHIPNVVKDLTTADEDTSIKHAKYNCSFKF